ncbi:methyltransferase domain-containing protein [Paenarthrobacter sp. CAP02]|uniref:methyltransferase domain-containing protein n=1 Tax=Paenarthrobacter sp. CAP02 TaxID=3158144 RepID=UPI0032DB8FC7
MLPDAVAALRCPVCHGPFRLLEKPLRTLSCPSGHLFDAARQGYFNLLTGKGTVFEADSAAMVAARQRFLDAGHYDDLAEAVSKSVRTVLHGPESLVLDAGTGTGHYLHRAIQGSSASAVGLDISKFALRRAARLNPDVANLVWDIWRPLPLADDTVDAVMVVFAPRNPAEFARVLRPGGTLVVVTPRPGHLEGIAERAGMLGIEEGKAERLAESLRGHFTSTSSTDLDIPLTLRGPEMADLAFMGPAGHHLTPVRLAELAAFDGSVSTTAMFRISVFTVS